MGLYIGCDLGGTNIKAGIVDLDTGKVLGSRSIPTLGKEGQKKVVGRMTQLIQTLIDESTNNYSPVQGVDVSAPGRLDLKIGMSSWAAYNQNKLTED